MVTDSHSSHKHTFAHGWMPNFCFWRVDNKKIKGTLGHQDANVTSQSSYTYNKQYCPTFCMWQFAHMGVFL